MSEMSTAEAEKTGERLMVLKVLRRILAERFDEAPIRETASIAGRLAEVSKEIEMIEDKEITSDDVFQYEAGWASG